MQNDMQAVKDSGAMHSWGYRLCCEFSRIVESLTSLSDADKCKAENKIRQMMDAIPFGPNSSIEITEVMASTKGRGR